MNITVGSVVIALLALLWIYIATRLICVAYFRSHREHVKRCCGIMGEDDEENAR